MKARLTVDADTGLFIKVERSRDITRNCEHARRKDADMIVHFFMILESRCVTIELVEVSHH